MVISQGWGDIMGVRDNSDVMRDRMIMTLQGWR